MSREGRANRDLKGRISEPFGRPSPSKDFVRLAIREHKPGQFACLIALRATVLYYGWDQTFPQWCGKETGKYPPGTIITSPAFKFAMRGTRRKIVICRSDSRQSTPAGLTNQFRVTSECTFRDLINIAHATKVDFGWMTTFHGKRIPSECWLKTDLPDDYLSMDHCYGITAA